MLRLRDKLKLLPPLAVFSLLLVIAGCNQDSIFDYISGETAPTPARIKGAPSKIVSAVTGSDEKLYVANGRLWELASPASRWERIAGPPGGFVVDVAAISEGVSKGVYALTIDNAAGKVWKREINGSSWTPLVSPDGGYGAIQNIFGAGGVLFATGAQGVKDYAILYQSEGKFIILEPTGSALLSGAGKAGSNYYLATTGQGIYKVSSSDVSTSPITVTRETVISDPLDIVGFLQAKDEAPADIIIGVSRGGRIVYIDSSGDITADQTSLGGTYTGGLALMSIPEQDNFNRLLLLGYRTGSSYEHGYVELPFKIEDGPSGATGRRIPGYAQPSSISEYRQYESSLRRYPVTALWVLDPDSESRQVIFAATTNQGLYSYRERSGGWEWNHEE